MNTASFLDQNLRSACNAEAQTSALRPSVIRSEFFRDYSLKRILEAPDAAWFDLLHTSGVGGKSTSAIAHVVAQEFADRFPKEWTQAQKLVASDGAAAHDAAWPVGALVQFIKVWVTPVAD